MKCECRDLECQSPAHGDCSPCGVDAYTVLFRIDMEDESGTPMCEGCADDAFESGLFEYRPGYSEVRCAFCGQIGPDCH